MCVCVSAALFSHSRNYAANKRYERVQRHMGSKTKKAFRKLERYLLTIWSAILSHVHSHVYTHACAAGTRGALGTVAGFFCVFLE